MSSKYKCPDICGVYASCGTYAIGGAPGGDYIYIHGVQKERCHESTGHGQCPHKATSGSWTCKCHGGQ